MTIEWTEANGGCWRVSRYRDIETTARDTARFVSQSTETGPDVPLTLDPPAHTAARAPLDRWFSLRSISRFEPDIRRLARAQLADLASPADLEAGFAVPFTEAVLLRILGVERVGDGRDGRWLEASVIEPDGLVAHLLGDAGDLEAVARVATSVFALGHRPTVDTLVGSLRYLARNPEMQQIFRDRLVPIDRAVEECLRMFAPAVGTRTVAEDTTVGGCPMARGDRLLLEFPAGNRDADEFDDADDYMILRNANRQMAFGVGIHRCVGMHLARLVLAIGLEEVVRMLAPFRPATVGQGGTGGLALVVEFDRPAAGQAVVTLPTEAGSVPR